RAIAQGWADSSRARAFLQDRAINDPEPHVRADILQILTDRWLSEAQVVNFLKERINNDPEPKTRAAAFAALVGRVVRAQLSSPTPSITLNRHQDEILAYYREGFCHADPAIRESAITTLSSTLWGVPPLQYGRQPTEIAILVRNLATNDPDVRLRVIALEA